MRQRVSCARVRVVDWATTGPRMHAVESIPEYIKAGRLVLKTRLKLATPDPSSCGALCRTCADVAYNKEGSPMASGSGLGSGSSKKPKYIDLDAPTLFSKDLWDTRSSIALPNPSTSLRGEHEAQESEVSKPARKRVRGHNTRVCIAILQGAVVTGDAESGVLG